MSNFIFFLFRETRNQLEVSIDCYFYLLTIYLNVFIDNHWAEVKNLYSPVVSLKKIYKLSAVLCCTYVQS